MNRYEVHLTLRDSMDVDSFRELCESINVKPVVLDLYTTTGIVPDAMTSSTTSGSDTDAFEYTRSLSDSIANRGLALSRVKIETVLTHPDCETQCAADQYYESHFPMIVSNDSRKDLDEYVTSRAHVHLSRNVFKCDASGMDVIMLTFRVFNTTGPIFQSMVDALVADLHSNGFKFGRPHVEFALFDTNISHDNIWVTK